MPSNPLSSTPVVVVQDGDRWLRFTKPVRTVEARRPAEVVAALREVETAVAEHNLYAAGFLTYEAGAAFELATHAPPGESLPLLWFGLYQAPQVLDRLNAPATSHKVGEWQPNLSQAAYATAVASIKAAIERGDTYQVNYTFPLHAPFQGDPWSFFTKLTAAQQAQFGAYLDLGRFAICSASPELFFALDNNRLTSRPMKGTAVRGRTSAEDREQAFALQQSVKNRAENVMIVDMIRNDMGRVAQIGSVAVPQLFQVERYPTLLQMTSTVTARTLASISEIFDAMFPCASITGAPKVRTMQLIHALEKAPRGLYTGAIGFVTPRRRAQFNVAIRTVVVDRERAHATYGVGSGIVWDSDAADEYAECVLKAEVLTWQRPAFDLLESLRWTPQRGYYLLDRHLARLRDSADYFDVPLDLERVRRELSALGGRLAQPAKVRLLVGQGGAVNAQAVPLEIDATVEPLRVGLAGSPIDPHNVWLYHKTTQRDVYAAARASRPACDEVILWNTHREVTEACAANLVVVIEGACLTPPVRSGLLAGTLRQHLLENGRLQERVITPDDLRRSEALYLINSVRGWRAATFVD